MSETLEEYKQRVARAGGQARAKSLTKAERAESARRAAVARWSKNRSLEELDSEVRNARTPLMKRPKVKKKVQS
ncbi:MAG TPA: hypothetical protein VI386_25940 [Candidatus Sulfotelmatobacter sp.]